MFDPIVAPAPKMAAFPSLPNFLPPSAILLPPSCWPPPALRSPSAARWRCTGSPAAGAGVALRATVLRLRGRVVASRLLRGGWLIHGSLLVGSTRIASRRRQAAAAEGCYRSLRSSWGRFPPGRSASSGPSTSLRSCTRAPRSGRHARSCSRAHLLRCSCTMLVHARSPACPAAEAEGCCVRAGPGAFPVVWA